MVPLPQRGRSENEDERTDKPKFEPHSSQALLTQGFFYARIP